MTADPDDVHHYLARNRQLAAGLVGLRLRSLQRLADAPAEEEPRLGWGPLLATPAGPDPATAGLLVDVDEGRSNVLLFGLAGADRVAEHTGRHPHRHPVMTPADRLGFLLSGPITGVDLVSRPDDPEYPHFFGMCGLRLRTAAGDAFIGTHLQPVRMTELAVLLPEEVSGDLTVTPLAGDDAGPGFQRLEYASGNEYDPGDPFGRTVLAVDALGVARLDNHHLGRHRAWRAVVDPALLARIGAALRAGGFPQAPQPPVPGGSALRSLHLDGGALAGRVLLPWHGADRLPGYGEAFALLDALVGQASGGVVPLAAPGRLPPAVLDGHEVTP